MNNVEQPRQTALRVTGERTLLQLQTLHTSRRPHSLPQLIGINLKLNPFVWGWGWGADLNADQIRILCFGHRE